jgi:hypothetical protein
MKKSIITGAIVFAALYPAAAGAANFKGTVVSNQHSKTRHVLVVSTNGLVRTVHTTKAAKAGSIVSVTAASRVDGTFNASRVAIVGHARKAHIRGVVLSRSHGMTFLSGGRSVIAVRSSGRALASVGTGSPPPGAVANVGVTIGTTGTLTQTSISTAGQSNDIVIQATVDSITPATATTAGNIVLKVGTQTFNVPLAAGTTLPATIVQGATVTLTVSFGANGPSAGSGDDEGDDDDSNDDNNDDGDNNNDDSGDDDSAPAAPASTTGK